MSDGYHPKGAVFDLNGVITETNPVHFETWKQTFEQYLVQRSEGDPAFFTWEEDYLPLVDGMPRYQG